MYLEEYQLKFHPLSHAEDYTKNIYLQYMLSVGSVESDKDFFQFVKDTVEKLAEIFKVTEDVYSLIRCSLTKTESDICRFAQEMESVGLSRIFIVDCLLMVYNSGCLHKNILEYIANLSDILKIKHDEIDELLKIVRMILERDYYEYRKSILNPGRINHEIFNAYATKFSHVFVVNEPDYRENTFIKASQAGADENVQEIVFENILLDNPENSWLNVQDKSRVMFYNCHFKKITFDPFGMRIHNVENVYIKKCSFDEVNSTLFEIEKCGEVVFEDCSFQNCPFEPDDMNYAYMGNARCIFINEAKSFLLERCIFKNCITNGSIFSRENVALVYLNHVQKFRLMECNFENCTDFIPDYISDYTDSDDFEFDDFKFIEEFMDKGTLFKLVNSECQNAYKCTVKNCSPSGDSRLNL